jgi:exopolysaccharide biosynthesis polyprenyl glycosylphosphotransferase
VVDVDVDVRVEGLAVSGLRPDRLLPAGLPHFPIWVRVADRVHSASRRPDVAVIDGGVTALAGLVAGLPPVWAVFAAVGVVTGFHVSRIYGHRSTIESQGVLWYPPRIVTTIAVVSLALLAAAPRTSVPTGNVLRFVLAAVVCLTLLRSLTWAMLSTARRARIGLRRALVVGSGEAARVVVRKLNRRPEAGLTPVGILSPDGRHEAGEGVGLGSLPADLPALIQHGGITHVVLVPEGNQDQALSECLELCDGLDVTFSMLPPLADLFLRPSMVTQVDGLPLIALGKVTRSRSNLPGKRLFDIVGAIGLLLLAGPLMLATAFAIKLHDRGPVLFRQRRVGQSGRTFWMIKFRSMTAGAETEQAGLAEHNETDGLLFKVRHDPRVTPVGRIIRKFSVDELPQLLNVVKGDMSLVGPRPLAVDPDAFGALDGKRHSVPPGMTGYWQIAGGNGLTYQEMVKLDLAYIQDWSFWLDLRILARTIPAVIHRHRYEAT